MDEFSLEAYESLAVQLPSFRLRGAELTGYISKIVTLGQLYAIVEENSLKGLMGFYANDVLSKNAYLSVIVVDSSLRGCGYGKGLLEVMFRSCKESGMTTVSLNVLKSNAGAIAFYERSGFVVKGAGRDDEHLVMTSSIVRLCSRRDGCLRNL